MKKTRFVQALVLCALPLIAQRDPVEVQIPMRDGKTLAADLYVPKGGGKYPTVLVQTPYNKNLMRPSFKGEGAYGKDSLFTDEHYVSVVTDWRGRNGSAKAGERGKEPPIGRDGFDTIAWIRAQEWSDGKVATWGPSALGRVQYETAREKPPGLVCSVPMVMPLALSYDIYYPGGALWNEFVAMLAKLGWDRRATIVQHPAKDEMWTRTLAANFTKAEDFEVPMLFIGGWYDIYTDGVIDAWKAVRARGGGKSREHSKIVMGPWLHRTDQAKNGSLEFPNAALSGTAKAHAFVDYWVRGVDNNFDHKEPEFTYYQMGANEWRSTNVWPPRGVKDREFHLAAGGALSARKPGGKAGAATIVFDPANPVPTVGGHVLDPTLNGGPQDQREKVESRKDAVVFSTEPLSADLAVAGKPRVKLAVSSDRTDTDFTAILTDVYPDGRSMLVGEGILRMRFRNGTAKEELMKPGEVYPISIDLPSTAITFRKGHRVRVIVSSSNYPKFDVNKNDGGPLYSGGAGVAAANTVHWGAGLPSAVVLPVQ